MIGVSPTYLSKVERDELPAPAEDKLQTIAKIIRVRPRSPAD
jgi:HTH-type transcriptional regulator, competence development regulator